MLEKNAQVTSKTTLSTVLDHCFKSRKTLLFGAWFYPQTDYKYAKNSKH